jgi:hypothetical protein
MTKTSEIQIGDFLKIQAWNTIGRVVEIKPAIFGDDSAINILLETDPDGGKHQQFRIEDGQFENLLQ